jgi:hypothetical protein
MTNRAAGAVWRIALLSGLVMVAALPAGASAANRQRLQVTIDRLPGQAERGSRPVALRFRLSRWTDEGVISSPAADDRFSMPPGFSLNPSVVPYCDRNRLAERGPTSCRAAQIGSGTLRLAAVTDTQALPAAGTVTVYNTRPINGHPTLLTYALVTQPLRSQFWFQSVVSTTRRGAVIEVRETLLNVYGFPLTVLGLDFSLGRTVGQGARRRSYLTGPARCGPPASRVFGLRTTFYDRFIGSRLDRPAGPRLSTSEPASC